MFPKTKTRLYYFNVTFLVIVLGIFSRKIEGIPLFFGDILYAVMSFYGLRFLFKISPKWTFLFSILFCFSVEISQTIQWEWLNTIRKTLIGHYILGEGFLWSDLAYYTIGSLVAYIMDKNSLKN